MAREQEITGTVKRVVFERNDFVIATLQDGPDIKGTAAPGEIKADLTYRFFGRTTQSEKYGEQFAFSSYAVDLPHEQEGVTTYLRKMADGIGVIAAGKLWDTFGSEAVDVLIKTPQRAVDAGCVTAKVADRASRSLRENVETQKTRIDLLSLFSGLGFPGQLIPSCIREWGAAAPRVIKNDPFRLVFANMPGCGFARVDHLHHRLGHPSTSPGRLVALAWSKVQDNSDGHTWVSEIAVLQKMADEVGYDSDPQYGIEKAVEQGVIVRFTGGGQNWLAMPDRAAAEQTVADAVRRLMAFPVSLWPDVDALVGLEPHQRDTLRSVLASTVAILTGTPGTGKTYCAAKVIEAARHLVPPDEIAVVAPTGKAAVRITQSLSEYGVPNEATTVHRLLQIAGHTRDGFTFRYNAQNPLPYRLLFVDEGSMLDTDLSAALFAALPDGAHIMVIGDPYQLPPVGHGAPLRDLLECPVSRGELTEIHRNSGLIVKACQDIKNGFRYETCERFDDEGNNFRSIESPNNAAILDSVRTLCQRLKQKAADEVNFDPIEDVQVLCVINEQSELGRYNLNRVLQAELNAHGEGGDAHPFRVGDKVICLSNGMQKVMDPTPGEPPDRFDGYFPTSAERKERYIANGDMGRVLALSPKALVVKFRHPERVVLINLPGAGKRNPEAEVSEAKDSYGPVDLGYAITTHRSQGSEWPYVILPLDENERTKRIVSRELLYTAISRAKKRCILIGRRAVADEWCQTVIMRKRKTFLRERVRAALAPAGANSVA